MFSKISCLASNLYDHGLFLTFAYTKLNANFVLFSRIENCIPCLGGEKKVSSDGGLYSHKVLFTLVGPKLVIYLLT